MILKKITFPGWKLAAIFVVFIVVVLTDLVVVIGSSNNSVVDQMESFLPKHKSLR